MFGVPVVEGFTSLGPSLFLMKGWSVKPQWPKFSLGYAQGLVLRVDNQYLFSSALQHSSQSTLRGSDMKWRDLMDNECEVPSDCFARVGYYVFSIVPFEALVITFNVTFSWTLFKAEPGLSGFLFPHRYIPQVSKFKSNDGAIHKFVGRKLDGSVVLEAAGAQAAIEFKEFQSHYILENVLLEEDLSKTIEQ